MIMADKGLAIPVKSDLSEVRNGFKVLVKPDPDEFCPICGAALGGNGPEAWAAHRCSEQACKLIDAETPDEGEACE